MISWKEVHSEQAEKVGYDAETLELFVKWRRGGRVSIYEGVPADIAREAAMAWSIGTFLNDSVKGVFPHRYARAEDVA